MPWSDLLRSLARPMGFGAADFLDLGLAVLLIGAALAWRRRLGPWSARLARRTRWCMPALAMLPVALRLLLLPHHPVPVPDVYDEFSHLLVADTLRHFRLANPPLPLPQFFETYFVLQQPTYSSIYPLGPGLALAIGWSIFGLPWAGVLLAVAAFCSLCYWMLRGWTSPEWALAGGILAVLEFGPLNLWTNDYWGGALAAASGCLVFGALPRLRAACRVRDACVLGAGLGLHLLIRPFESLFVFLAVALYFAPDLPGTLLKGHRHAAVGGRLAAGEPSPNSQPPTPSRPLPRKPSRAVTLAGWAAAALLPAVLLTLAQNRAVTGSWTTLPERLSQYQYGVPAALTFETPPAPHHELTPQQAMDYKMQLSFHQGPETLVSFFQRLEYRVRFYRFFFLPPLYLAAAAFLASWSEYRCAWVGMTLALFALGTNFFPAFQFHYQAAATCLFVLAAVVGLEQISRIRIGGHPAGREAAALIFLMCCAQFLFWYGMHLAETSEFSQEARQYETWDAINHGYPARRIEVARELAGYPGKLLVFVRYTPQHIFQDEWVYNGADLEAARVIWARDLGSDNEKLLPCFPRRTVLLLEPDARPPRLSPYGAGESQ